MRYSISSVLLIGILVSFLPVHSQKLESGPQVLTFFSSVDDTEQPYGVYIPKNYDASRKYPLVIMLHGAGSNHRLALRRVFGKSNAPGETDVEASRYFPAWKDVDFIVASPFARGTMGYQGVAEKDVYDVLADVKRRFNIDEDRTYLTGLSMGGGGTLWIGLTRPDIWAALVPVCPAPPRGTDEYLPNSLNIPMYFHHGDADQAVPVTVSRDWVKRLNANGTHVEYKEYPGVQHNSWENAYADGAVFTWLTKYRRNRFPERVKFNSQRFEYNNAYWVTIDKLTPGVTASIDARFTGQNKLDITAANTDAFTVTVAGHPRYESAAPIDVTINGKKVRTSPDDSLSFVLKNGKWTHGRDAETTTGKKRGAEGPINAAFSDRHIYVYGTAGNPSQEELKNRIEVATKAADWAVYRNAFLGRVMVFPRIVADKDVRASDIESANLILFGTPQTNSVIQKHSDQLPMQLTTDDDQVGLLYIFPVGSHYVVVNSGLPWWISSEPSRFGPPLPFQFLGNFKDFVLYKGSSGSPLVEGNFSNEWTLTAEQRKKLTGNGVSVRESDVR